MKTNKDDKKDNKFDADEVLKEDKVSFSSTTTNNVNANENLKIDLKPVKFYKTYELNEEGLKLYGMYKKQQHLNMIKWSLFGTSIGCLFAAIVDMSFQKSKFQSKDIIKTFVLLGSIGLFTFHGIQASTIQFRTKQRELSQLYGKELDDPEDNDE